VSRIALILVADRNPHVRAFLRRELAAEGYRIRLADRGREVLDALGGGAAVDLLVIDPDLPDLDPEALLEGIQSRAPGLPVIVHACAEIFRARSRPGGREAFVEKRGDSVVALKRLIGRVLGRKGARPVPAGG
jgi:CheY-like chemotaxis protein